MKPIRDILEANIFEVMKLDHLSDEVKADLFKKAHETIMYRVMLRLADVLPETDLEKLQALLEKQDEADIEEFFDSRRIDVDQITAQEALAYKVEMAALADAVKPAHD